jgi:hypothetical protein
MDCRFIRCLRPLTQVVSVLFQWIIGQTDAAQQWTVGSSGATDFCSFNSSIHPTLVELGASIHLVVFKLTLSLHAVYQVHWCLHRRSLLVTIDSSDGVFSFSFLILACAIFASLGCRKSNNLVNNLVSPIDHVVMNQQNQTWTNGLCSHVRYSGTWWERECATGWVSLLCAI